MMVLSTAVVMLSKGLISLALLAAVVVSIVIICMLLEVFINVSKRHNKVLSVTYVGFSLVMLVIYLALFKALWL